MAETKRTGIIDKDWGNILANVVESTATPWTYGLVALNPDWSDIGWPASAIVIWNPVVGWNPWRILYIDQAGNLFGDDSAVRDSGVQKQTTIGSGTYAQTNANDWVSAEVYFQADVIGDTGNSISLVFDGIDDADTVLNAWNTANPWNTASIVDWLGTTVPTAGTRTFVGWWEIIYESGTVNNGISTFFQGSGSTLLDTTNGKIWFSTTGNLISVIWEPSLWFVAAGIDSNTGNLWAMVVSDSGINFFVTDQSTYNARLQGDDVEIILDYNGTYLWVNGLSWPLWWDSSSNRYILPTNVTPSVGDTLAVAGISGNDYALDFVTPWGWWWTPAGADTEIQYNNSGAFWASSDLVFDNTAKTFKVMSSANNLLLVDAATGDYWLGDLDGIGNSTRLFIDDTGSVASIAAGWDRIRLNIDGTAFTAKLWDVDSIGNDTSLIIDDATRTITALAVNGANQSTITIDDTFTRFDYNTATTNQFLLSNSSWIAMCWSSWWTWYGLLASNLGLAFYDPVGFTPVYVFPSVAGADGQSMIIDSLAVWFAYPQGIWDIWNATNSTKVVVNDTAKTIKLSGGIIKNYTAQTGTYAILRNDYTINCTSGTFTVTLPTAVGFTGQEYVIKNSGAGAITVATTSSQTIDGVTTQILSTLMSITVMSNWANRIII